jgi:GNAT superfamily N-acetyltransferase
VPDLLVNLLKLPAREADAAFNVRHAQPWELTPLRDFVTENFSSTWADEMAVGFAHQPISVYVATIDRQLVGFAAYECTRRAYFGPTGVASAQRGKGIGKALLLASLESARAGLCLRNYRQCRSGPLLSTDGRCDYYP